MKVLIACEYSGVVRDAFIAKGHDAMSCELLPTDVPGPHYQGNVLDVLNYPWDLMIAHPPCTHLSVSGARHFAAKRMDGWKTAVCCFIFHDFGERHNSTNCHREPGLYYVELVEKARSSHSAVAIRAR